MLRAGDTYTLAGREYNVLNVEMVPVKHLKHGLIDRYLKGQRFKEEEWWVHHIDYRIEVEPVTPDALGNHRRRTLVWPASKYLNS